MRLICRGLGTGFLRGRIVLAVALLVTVGAVALRLAPSSAPAGAAQGPAPSPALFSADSSTSAAPQVRVAYSHLPLVFEANQGQSDPQVKFLARGSGYGLFLTGQEAVLVMQSSSGKTGSGKTGVKNSVVRMQLAGANTNVSVAGTDLLPGKSNYFIGNNPAKWHREVPQFARVQYRGVYPGVDLVYYGNQGRLEYDFEVAPGADPRQVALRFQGTEPLHLNPQGDLVLATGAGGVNLEAPRAYQKIDGQEKLVDSKFVLRARNEVGFDLGDYDRSRALIIDPVLTYSTYFGGSGDEGCSAITPSTGFPTSGCPAATIDSAFNMYLVGTTTSANFPIQGPLLCCGTLNVPPDVFITKLNSTGSAISFSTFLGGNGADYSAGVAVDSGFNVIVAGTTGSSDFPTGGTVGAYQPTALSSGNHTFVTKIDLTGANLIYSTYLSGADGQERTAGMALDPKGKIYLTGTTTSITFPVVNPYQSTSKATSQFFLSKLDPTLSGSTGLTYSTYFGGGNPANGQTVGGGITVEAVANANNAYNVYITGGTSFLNTQNNIATDFPILNGFQSCLDQPTNPSPCDTSLTATDVFVAKFNPALAGTAQLLYSTYLGGSGDDVGYGVAVDSGTNAYVTGSTASSDIIIPSILPFQRCLDQPVNPDPGDPCAIGLTAPDAFVAKIGNPLTGTSTFPLNYFSYLGGSGDDTGLGIVVDSNQGARLTGWTNSPDFPVVSPVQGGSGGATDAFVALLYTLSGSTANFSSYLGGTGNDFGTAVAIDVQGNTYVAGETKSTNFPTKNPIQAANAGLTDAFISKLGPTVNLTMTAATCTTPPCTPTGVGNPVTYTFTITNIGDLTTGVTFTDFLPTDATFTSAAVTGAAGSCGAANGGQVVCSLGTLNAGAVVIVTVVLTPTVQGTLSDSAQVTANGGFTATASASATINDFRVDVAPASVPVKAGAVATYTVTVTPTGVIPNSVSLSCSSGLPTGASCAFTTSPIPDFNEGSAKTSVLNINTTARPNTSFLIRPDGGRGIPLYATWLPICGLTLLGLGIRGKTSRKGRILAGLLLGVFFSLMIFQAGCSSSTNPPVASVGTPAGPYTIVVTGTSGKATRTNTLEMVVQ